MDLRRKLNILFCCGLVSTVVQAASFFKKNINPIFKAECASSFSFTRFSSPRQGEPIILCSVGSVLKPTTAGAIIQKVNVSRSPISPKAGRIILDVESLKLAGGVTFTALEIFVRGEH